MKLYVISSHLMLFAHHLLFLTDDLIILEDLLIRFEYLVVLLQLLLPLWFSQQLYVVLEYKLFLLFVPHQK